jgi:hypothetical protein
MPTTTTQTNQTIHANISTELKQSVRDWCQRNDLTESQLLRRAIHAILSGKVSAQ